MGYFNPSQARQKWRDAKALFEAKVKAAQVKTPAQILLRLRGRQDLGPLLDAIESADKVVARYKESEGQGPKLNAAKKVKLDHIIKAKGALALYVQLARDLVKSGTYPELKDAVTAFENDVMQKLLTPLNNEHRDLTQALNPR
jgi:hypothetical protein